MEFIGFPKIHRNLLLNRLGLFILHHPSKPKFNSLEKKPKGETDVK